jgi:PST family polysaccharide transporter
VERKAILGIPWTLLAYVSKRLVTLGTTVVLARLLVPSDFGLVAFASLLISFATHSLNLGLGPGLILRTDLDERGQGTALSLMLATNLGAAATLMALSPLTALVFSDDRIVPVLIVLATPLLIGGVSSFYGVVLQRELEFRRHFFCQGLEVFVMGAVSIALAATGAGVWSIVVGQIAGSLAYMGAVVAVAPYRVRPAFDRRDARKLWLSGRGFILQGSFSFVEQNADYFTVGALFGARQLGFYSMAYRLSELPYNAIADPVAQVTFPGFARMRHRAEDLTHSFLSVLRLVSFVACPLGVMLAATADPLVHVAFGEKWAGVVGPLSVLGIWAAIRPIQATTDWMLNSVGQAGLVGMTYAGMLVGTLPVLILAAKAGGIVAVAWVMLGNVVLTSGIVSVIASRKADISFRRQWQAIRPVALACPAAWATAWAISHVAEETAAGVALSLAVAGGLGVYATVVSWSEPGLIRHAFGQIGRILRSTPVATASEESTATGAAASAIR